MTKDDIERYGTFNTKGWPGELIFDDFDDQSIPSNYHNLLNDDDNNGNIIPGSPVDDDLPDNKGVEDAVVKNDEDINDEIILDD